MEDNWQTIESAPKDGAIVLIFDDDCVCIARYLGTAWVNPEFGFMTYGTPTHWQPLPQPPNV